MASRWVVHQLADEQKQQRVELCGGNLAKFRDSSWRLCDFITGYETWIYQRQIHHKSKNASCLSQGQSLTTVACRRKFEAKNLFSICFKWNDPVLIHCVDEDKTRYHNHCIENCLKLVAKEIWKQRTEATVDIKLLGTTMLDRIFIVTLLII